MSSRTLLDRLLSPAGFAVALLLFLLPFLTVSCEAPDNQAAAQVDATFTGIDLMVGGSPDLSAVDSAGRRVDAGADVVAEVDATLGTYYPPQPLVIIAGVLLLLGVAGSLLLPAALRAWPSVVAAGGALVLLAIEIFAVAPSRFTAAMDAVVQPGDFGDPTYRSLPGVGFVLCAVVLLALAVWQARQALRPRLMPTDEPPQGPGSDDGLLLLDDPPPADGGPQGDPPLR